MSEQFFQEVVENFNFESEQQFSDFSRIFEDFKQMELMQQINEEEQQ
jgi:hypothetical protein